ncbi:hypothetical protein DFH09DRAFT_1346431 [Mycena vulgaris]|nr:hypothetical protein DFH09DRAFT_1346431 [Mycena vulgaris]
MEEASGARHEGRENGEIMGMVRQVSVGNDTDEDLAPIRPKARPRIRVAGAAGDLATDPFNLSHRRRAISKKSDQEPVPTDKADETSTNAPAPPEDVDNVPNKTTPILPTMPAGSPRPVFYSSSALWTAPSVQLALARLEANREVAAEMSWAIPPTPPAPLPAPQFMHLVDIARRPSLFPPRKDESRPGPSARATTSHSSLHNASPQFRPAPHGTSDSPPHDPVAEGDDRDDDEEDDFLDILGGGSDGQDDDADALGGGRDNESDNEGSIVSSYSTTAAATRKEDARHNKIAIQSTHVPLFVAQEELDAEDMEQYTAEFSKKAKGKGKQRGDGEDPDDKLTPKVTSGKGKGKQKAVAESVAASDRELDGDGDDDDDDDEEDSEPPPATEWDLTSGPLSNEARELALTARRVYHASIAAVARQAGKQTKFRAENKKSPDVTKEAYKQLMRTAYDELFSSLSEEEKKDPAARKECVQEVLDWYEANSMAMLDDRKGDGRGRALMSKIIQPFIHQVFGFGIDPVSDVAIVWGGTPTFYAVYDKYKIPIKAKLNDMKAMIQVVRMAAREAANGKASHPIFVDFSKKPTEKTWRDARRRHFSEVCLNDIHIISNARRAAIEAGSQAASD